MFTGKDFYQWMRPNLSSIYAYETLGSEKAIYEKAAMRANESAQQPLQGLFHEWEQLAEAAVSLENAGQHNEWMYERDDLKARTAKALGGEAQAVIPADADVAMASAITEQGKRVEALRGLVRELSAFLQSEADAFDMADLHILEESAIQKRDTLLAHAKQLLGEEK